jgi:hypothetical protein
VSHAAIEEHSVTPQSRPGHTRGKSGSFSRHGSISVAGTGGSHRSGASQGTGLPAAKVAGVKCILCETTTFEKPWFAEKCKHVACSDCWLTWIETETTVTRAYICMPAIAYASLLCYYNIIVS